MGLAGSTTAGGDGFGGGAARGLGAAREFSGTGGGGGSTRRAGRCILAAGARGLAADGSVATGGSAKRK